MLDFIRRLVTGRVRKPPYEHSALPLNRAAYLFQNWQQASALQPPVSTQLGFYLGITLVFVILAGLLLDWTFALSLLVVIGLHEAGHWLAMRIMGYRDLHLQMLPLVGGVTLGRDTCHKAAHRILASLMGPLPGIILGTLILSFSGMEGDWVTKFGITLLVVNYLSLLPIMPLDGGQLLKALVSASRYSVLIALEWLGGAVLLVLGWLSDSLFLYAMALLPIFSGLALIRIRRVVGALCGVTDGAEKPKRYYRILAVIQAIDKTDKSYRPLKKKVREIVGILTALELKPVSKTVARGFLAIYLATILLPPALVYATSPGIEKISMRLFSDSESMQQTAQVRTLSPSISQLVMELAERHRNISDPYRSQGERVIVRAPASNKSITHAEKRLGIQLDDVHHQFLETSNGFINQLSPPEGKDYLLYPVESVVRFAQKLPGIVNRLRSEDSSNIRQFVRIKEASGTIEAKTETFNINQLAPMLVIGNPYEGNYLLLDTISQSETPSFLYEIYETPSGLEGRRFKSLRHYLKYHLSMIQTASLNQ
jgi:Zn-dependent protease